MRRPCFHQWETIGKESHWVDSDFGSRLIYTFFALSCTKCGRIKGKKIRGDFA